MSCTGKCPITRYELEINIIKTQEGGDCSNIDINAAIETHMKASFPDAQHPCECTGEDEGCLCLELPNQDPPPSKWSPQFMREVQFQVPDTECEIFYKVMYKYRTRLYDANCARGPIPGNQ